MITDLSDPRDSRAKRRQLLLTKLNDHRAKRKTNKRKLHFNLILHYHLYILSIAQKLSQLLSD